jgi:hypothetical protein
MNCRGWHRHGSASDRRTPRPWTCFGVAAGLLARRSRSPPVFPTRCGVSDVDREQLTAYSCGGSAGFSRGSRDSPASLLATKSCDVVDRDGYIWCYSLRPVNARSDAVAKFRLELCKACENPRAGAAAFNALASGSHRKICGRRECARRRPRPTRRAIRPPRPRRSARARK